MCLCVVHLCVCVCVNMNISCFSLSMTSPAAFALPDGEILRKVPLCVCQAQRPSLLLADKCFHLVIFPSPWLINEGRVHYLA